METAVELRPAGAQNFEHGYDAMQAFLDGAAFAFVVVLTGDYAWVDDYPEGTEFLIHYAKIINDYAYSRVYPRADRQFSVRFRKPITKDISGDK